MAAARAHRGCERHRAARCHVVRATGNLHALDVRGRHCGVAGEGREHLGHSQRERARASVYGRGHGGLDGAEGLRAEGGHCGLVEGAERHAQAGLEVAEARGVFGRGDDQQRLARVAAVGDRAELRGDGGVGAVEVVGEHEHRRHGGCFAKGAHQCVGH